MNSSYYKYCIVPQCKNTTIKTPNKLFIYVPNNRQIRKKWLILARRKDASSLSKDSRMYFCEDHFDMPSDMVNYMQYHIMGTVSKVQMKPGCMPSKFECQEDGRKRAGRSIEQPYMLKNQRIMIVAESLNETEKTLSPSLSQNTSDKSSNCPTDESNMIESQSDQIRDKSVRAFKPHKFKSKAVRTKLKSSNWALSPLKLSVTSISTTQLNYLLTVVNLLKKIRNWK